MSKNNLTSGGVDSSGVRKLCATLDASSLVSLDVSYNNITGASAAALSSAVLYESPLTEFCTIKLDPLRVSKIGNDSIKAYLELVGS